MICVHPSHHTKSHFGILTQGGNGNARARVDSREYRSRPCSKAQDDNVPLDNAHVVLEPKMSPKHEFPLKFKLLSKRVALVTIVLTSLLLATVLIIGEGLALTKVDVTDMDGETQKRLQGRYNWYSGAISAFVSMTSQQIMTMLVPVFLLCFMSRNILHAGKSFADRWGPAVFAMAASWIVGQGLTSVSIQFVPSVDIIMSDSDLEATDIALPALETIAIQWNITAAIPSTDTILRNAIRPSSVILPTQCKGQNNPLFESVAAEYTGNSVRYGFKLNPWLGSLLNKSIDNTNSSYKFDMLELIKIGSVKPSDLPNGSPLDTANLFNHGFEILNEFAGSNKSSDIEISTSDTAQMLLDMRKMILSANWSNISTSEIGIQFSAIELSPRIQFNAISFDLPVKNEIMNQWLSGILKPDNFTARLDANDFCNEHACVLRMPKTAFSDQVSAFRLCKKTMNEPKDYIQEFRHDDCPFPLDASVLLVSIAHRIVIDDINVTYSPSGATQLSLNNPSKYYSVTVGRLSWQVQDLASVYGAKCGSNTTCRGLNFTLDNGGQHLLVSEHKITELVTSYTPGIWSKWEELAIAQNHIDSTYNADLIAPSEYRAAKGSIEWNFSDPNCSAFGSYFINDMRQRHMYSTDPLQAAYTAGMFWLLQNARVLNVDVDDRRQLNFDGNRLLLTPYVSMPRESAFMTLFGCLLVLFAEAFVSHWSRETDEVYDLHVQLSTAHNAAGLMFNTSQYPPFLVRTEILPMDEFGATISFQSDQNGYDIHEYVITHIVLRHRENGSMSSIKIRDVKSSNSAA